MTVEELLFIASLMGKPHVPGAEGPDAYDCWGVAKTVQRELFHRELPSIKAPPTDIRMLVAFVREHMARDQWKVAEIDRQNGQLVELAHGKHPFHIGVYLDIDGGGILHSLAGIGVAFDRPIVLTASGWRKFIYHDWIG